MKAGKIGEKVVGGCKKIEDAVACGVLLVLAAAIMGIIYPVSSGSPALNLIFI